MKVYTGKRVKWGCIVEVDGKPLPMRLDLRNHSLTGFEWGYGGSGPAQLALATLTDCLGNDEKALRLHQRFKFRVVGNLPRDGWTLTEKEIRRVVAQLEKERRLELEEPSLAKDLSQNNVYILRCRVMLLVWRQR